MSPAVARVLELRRTRVLAPHGEQRSAAFEEYYLAFRGLTPSEAQEAMEAIQAKRRRGVA